MNAEPRRKASPFIPPYLQEPNSSPFNPPPLASIGAQQQPPLENEGIDPRLHMASNKSSHSKLRNTFGGSRAFEPEHEEDNDRIVPHHEGDLGHMEFSRNHPSNRRQSNISHEREQVAERSHGLEKAGHMGWSNNHPITRRRSDEYSSTGPNEDAEHSRMEVFDDDVDMTHDGLRDSFTNHHQPRDNDEASEPESESLFVSQNDDRTNATAGPRVVNIIEKRAEPHRRISNDAPKRMTNLHRHPARRPSPPPFESNIGSNRRSSRYSGQKSDNWHVNKFREPVDPRLTLELPGHAPIHLQKEFQIRSQQYDDDYYHGMYPGDDDVVDDDQGYDPQSPLAGRYSGGYRRVTGQRSSDGRPPSPVLAQPQSKPKSRVQKVSKASLRKRGLKEGQEEEVLQRGYGVNDPENVEIVNMKETGDFSFEDIARILNDKRLDEGRDPKLTTTGVNGRYNRTAPTLFESQGLHFVSLIERKRNPTAARMHGKPIGEVGGEPQDLWNANEHDKILVDAVREYNSEKWSIVAEKVAEKTGLRFPENQLAKRFVLL